MFTIILKICVIFNLCKDVTSYYMLISILLTRYKLTYVQLIYIFYMFKPHKINHFLIYLYYICQNILQYFQYINLGCLSLLRLCCKVPLCYYYWYLYYYSCLMLCLHVFSYITLPWRTIVTLVTVILNSVMYRIFMNSESTLMSSSIVTLITVIPHSIM